MSRKSSRSQATVERLLEERHQFEEWLAKLDAAEDPAVPAAVREKVRADYRGRLEEVLRQLARHESELETRLAAQEMRREQLQAERRQREESLAEAVLRHKVGEYDPDEFAALQVEADADLSRIATELESAEADIVRFDEILRLIQGALPEAEPPAPPEPGPEAGDEETSAAASLRRVSSQIDALDELEFIRSVTGLEHEHVALRPAVPPAAESEPVAAAPPPPPEPVAAAPPPPPEPVVVAPAPRPEPPRARAPAPPAPLSPAPAPPPPPTEVAATDDLPEPVEKIVPEVPGAPQIQDRLPDLRGEAEDSPKTLRCTECGTYNVATEWYCEKCGAELSAF